MTRRADSGVGVNRDWSAYGNARRANLMGAKLPDIEIWESIKENRRKIWDDH